MITNIDADHLDCYADLDDIKASFTQYASSVPFFGAAICCLDDEHVRSILPSIDRKVITYGTRRQAHIRAENIRQDGRTMHFDLLEGERGLGPITLHAPGRHNVLNALAAIAVGLELDMTFDDIQRGVASFEGVDRRMHEIADACDRLVIDDYAHHPTEVHATLEGAAGAWPDRRIVAVFQPHLYSRTRQFVSEFGGAFFDADVLVCMDIYPAREAPEPGVTGELIANAARSAGHPAVTYVPKKDDLVDTVVGMSRPGDVILTLGAGDIWRQNRAIAQRLIDMEAGEAS